MDWCNYKRELQTEFRSVRQEIYVVISLVHANLIFWAWRALRFFHELQQNTFQ